MYLARHELARSDDVIIMSCRHIAAVMQLNPELFIATTELIVV